MSTLEKHMSESAWWCFLSSGVPMGSHMSVVTCMKVCVLADSGSGWFRPSHAQSQMDCPIWAVRWSYAWNSGRPTLALRIAVHVLWQALRSNVWKLRNYSRFCSGWNIAKTEWHIVKDGAYLNLDMPRPSQYVIQFLQYFSLSRIVSSCYPTSSFAWGCLRWRYTHVRVSVMMLPVLRGSDGKSHVSCHMHESVCFSRFRFRPSDAQSQDGLPDYPIWAARWSYAWNSGRPTLALRIAVHVPGCGWPWSCQAFQVFEDNLGDCSKIANLLPNGRVWPCVSVLVAKKVVTSGVEN